MPDFNVKSFNELAETIEKVADGIKLHGSEQDFPSEMTEEKLRSMRSELEKSREEYEMAFAKARQLMDVYEEVERSIREDISRFKTMIYGFYGKKNRVVMDFGLKPWKERSSSRKKTPAGSAKS